MSNRDSLGFGDLLPQDVVDIFAQEKLSKKGRKQRSRSLGRALGWLKGKKNKKVESKGQNPGLGPAFDLALDTRPAGCQGTPKGAPKSGKQGHQQSNSHAVPKRDDSEEKTPAPIVLQENVFIEVSRPKYLEDLHSEALEGLKLMQQEERISGPEYPDNESTVSTVSIRAEVDGGGFTTDSTIPDTSSTVSVKSSVSSRSSRSGLTRQGSTFRPLNSGKKSDKGRSRRRHRRTIAGIPHHLQREFGLDRAEWTVGPHLEELVNGDSDVPQLAVDSPSEEKTEVIHPLISVQEEQLNVAQAEHVDDLALLQRLGPAQSGGDRPWSLAVPGMTTGQTGPPSPVMSMSPQAAYLSKIIPNAVLPPSIEVVEISRGSSRNSVRTVSKSSLVLSSPTSSRASSRASTARSTSSRSSTLTSASRQNHFHLSDSSCWSDSDTLVSDSSTISSSSTPRQRDAQEKVVSKKQNKISVRTDSPKHSSNGKIVKGVELKKDGPFVRSLSVMKPRRAPPPPSRSYSLHNKMKRRSRDLAEVKIPGETNEENMKKRIDSPGYNADTSSLDESSTSKTPSPIKPQQNVTFIQNSVSTAVSNAETLQANSYSKVISPSSGYSSQDATSPKKLSPNKKGLLAKLHKLFPATTAAGLPKSAVTQPEASKSAPGITASDKNSVKALKELFSIPPHPKVQAPPPPPPEVWSHSPRSIELLLGPPALGNTYAIVKKNPKDKRPYRLTASTSTEATGRGEEQKQSNNTTVESKKVHVSQEGSLKEVNRMNESERLTKKNIEVKEHRKVQASDILSSVLVRTVDRDTDRLPAIAEEHKTNTQNTKNPSISSVHISPRLPTKQMAGVPNLQKVVSPESSWPPPPPPVSQGVLGSPDETDLPLPPPPTFTEAEIVHPVQVPPDKPVPSTSNVSTLKPQPLNIPPPPNYTAPPPPIKTFPEKVKLFSPQTKDAPPPPKTLSPPKQAPIVPTISKPPPPAPMAKEISSATTGALPSTPAQLINGSTPPVQKYSSTPAPPEVPPPPSQKLLLDIVSSKIVHVPSIKPTLSPLNSEVPPPPDLIPPPPSKEVVILPSIVADLPTSPPPQVSDLLHNQAPPPTEEATSELTQTSSSQTSSSQSVVTKTEIITEVSIPPPKDFPSPPPVVSTQPCEVLSPPEPIEVLSFKISTLPSEAAPAQAAEAPSSPTVVAVVPPEVSKSLPEEESTLSQIEVTHPPAEISASPVLSIPQPEDVSKPTVEDISRPQEILPVPVEMSVQPINDLSPQLPEEHSEVPPPTEAEPITTPTPVNIFIATNVLSPPPDVTLAPPEESPVSSKEGSSPEIVVEEAAEPHVIEHSSPTDVEERFLPVVVEVSYPELSEETSTDALEEHLQESQKTPEEKEIAPVEEAPSVTLPNEDSDPKSKEPAMEKAVEHSEQSVSNGTDSMLQSWKSILTPPQSIPPPPPIEQSASDPLPFHEPNNPKEIPSQSEPSKPEDFPSEPEVPLQAESTDQEKSETLSVPSPIKEVLQQEPASDTPEKPSEATVVAPAVVEVSQNVNCQEETIQSLSPQIKEVPKQEPASDTAEQSEEPAPAPTVEEVAQNTNSVSDQAINGSPESPKAEDVKLKDKEETSQTSPTNEAPQKPIRRSLVISPPSSPPATATMQPTPFKSTSPTTTVSTTTNTTRSPPAMTPSMNLQEAIRLRTAARSHNGPSSRFGIHSPPGFDVRKSPTSTASFIFSKSNKKVVIETRSEAKVEKKTEGLVTKPSAEQTTKKEFKVPPPVAKKPKTKTKEVESGAQTAGQEDHSETVKDIPTKPNGTAVEGH